VVQIYPSINLPLNRGRCGTNLHLDVVQDVLQIYPSTCKSTSANLPPEVDVGQVYPSTWCNSIHRRDANLPLDKKWT